MVVLKGDSTCVEVRYWRRDNFGASLFFVCCHREQTYDLDSPCPAKDTLDVSSEMRVKLKKSATALTQCV